MARSHTVNELLSVREAETKGIKRLRKPIWANPLDHIELDPPWVHLYCPFNKECNGRDPVDLLKVEFNQDSKEWVEYTGPLPTSDEYLAEQKVFEGVLKK